MNLTPSSVSCWLSPPCRTVTSLWCSGAHFHTNSVILHFRKNNFLVYSHTCISVRGTCMLFPLVHAGGGSVCKYSMRLLCTHNVSSCYRLLFSWNIPLYYMVFVQHRYYLTSRESSVSHNMSVSMISKNITLTCIHFLHSNSTCLALTLTQTFNTSFHLKRLLT